MLTIHSLLPTLKSNYPRIAFEPGSDFIWSPREQTVYYNKQADNEWVMLLHELAHGLLGHAEYAKDVQLILIERQAWDKAQWLAVAQNETIDDTIIEENLDSYRDWLHKRSTCPNCQANGVQTKKQVYNCLACHYTWRVNEARTCGLKRYSL